MPMFFQSCIPNKYLRNWSNSFYILFAVTPGGISFFNVVTAEKNKFKCVVIPQSDTSAAGHVNLVLFFSYGHPGCHRHDPSQ
jgi:hypothetical protein